MQHQPSKVIRIQAPVKFFSRNKGYGFIKRPNVKLDIFFSAQELDNANISSIGENDILEFDLIPVQGKGGKARNLKLISKVKNEG